jgi:aerobic-type carbon monoxide dehydrogenase small subunit (CoxS/CutS family)
MEVKKDILFTLIHKEEVYKVYTYTHQYYSLMTLISDYLGTPGFGICSGMGSCGTCMVEIREQGTKSGRHSLACDVRVNDELANTIIIVPDAVY